MCVCTLCSTTAFHQKPGAPSPPRSRAANRHHPAHFWKKTATKDEFSAAVKPAPPCPKSHRIRMRPALGLVVRGTEHRNGCDPFDATAPGSTETGGPCVDHISARSLHNSRRNRAAERGVVSTGGAGSCRKVHRGEMSTFGDRRALARSEPMVSALKPPHGTGDDAPV